LRPRRCVALSLLSQRRGARSRRGGGAGCVGGGRGRLMGPCSCLGLGGLLDGVLGSRVGLLCVCTFSLVHPEQFLPHSLAQSASTASPVFPAPPSTNSSSQIGYIRPHGIAVQLRIGLCLSLLPPGWRASVGSIVRGEKVGI